MVAAQELSDGDMASLNTVAERLIGDIIIFMTAVAHFHLSGCVNKQNFHYRVDKNSQQLHQRPLHNDRVTGVEWQTWSHGLLIL
jgi:hypothetical protein